jgi:hypothetical protein
MADGANKGAGGPGVSPGPPVDRLLAQRLEWVKELYGSLQRACGNLHTSSIREDPTRKDLATVVFHLQHPLEDGSARYVKDLVTQWARLNDIEPRSVEVSSLAITATLHVKYRGGGGTDYTPWDTRPVPPRRGGGFGRNSASKRRGRR